jgi:signal transduction histidine kinase
MSKKHEEGKKEAEFYIDLMSHDIRNFNQITMGYLELLSLSDKLSGTDMSYIEKAQKGVAGSNKLIENIKKIRKIRETADRNIERKELGDIIRLDISDVLKELKGEKVNIIDNMGIENRYVMVNEFVHDIFRHVLENAIKYNESPEKEININISPVSIDGKDFWNIMIADNGKGIPDERKPSLFDRMTKTTKGSGVGLSIIKVILDKYGGYINVNDRVKGDPTKGTAFNIGLPMSK